MAKGNNNDQTELGKTRLATIYKLEQGFTIYCNLFSTPLVYLQVYSQDSRNNSRVLLHLNPTFTEKISHLYESPITYLIRNYVINPSNPKPR